MFPKEQVPKRDKPAVSLPSREPQRREPQHGIPLSAIKSTAESADDRELGHSLEQISIFGSPQPPPSPLMKAVMDEHKIEHLRSSAPSGEAEQADSGSTSAASTPESAPYTSGATPPEDAQKIIDAFNTSGLLIRTLQAGNAEKEFDNLDETPEQASTRAERGEHSGLRKWTLAHKDLLPNYYKMGPEVMAAARYMAILADPNKVGNRFVGFHEQDAFSGNLRAGTKLINQPEATDKIKDLLGKLKRSQEKIKKPLENNEVQTLGFSREAVNALLFKGSGDSTKPESWQAAKPDFQRLVNGIQGKGPMKSFHVFTYVVKEGHTSLQYLDKLSPQSSDTLSPKTR